MDCRARSPEININMNRVFRILIEKYNISIQWYLHWVSAKENVKAEVRLYDRLFQSEYPEKGGDFIDNLSQESLTVINESIIEKSMETPMPGCVYQFERTGYFIADSKDCIVNKLVFNRAVSLRDSWARINKNFGK